VSVDHSTVHRWVIKLLPVLEKAFRLRKRSVGRSWRMDETYSTPSQRSPPALGVKLLEHVWNARPVDCDNQQVRPYVLVDAIQTRWS
jgi:hypothetical protein